MYNMRIYGLYYACKLSQKYKDHQIHIIESDNSVGGKILNWIYK